MSNLICVHLYGDGSRDARLRAEYIYCDCANECSAYKQGKCFCVTTLFGVRCDKGSVSRIDGGTKRSKAYARVYSDAKANERYAALKYPDYDVITRIGNNAFLTLPYIRLELLNDQIICGNPYLSASPLMIDAEKLTPENIKTICDYRPRAMMGGVITAYQEKTVPMFLHQLSLLFPDKYTAFASAYPQFEIKPPNWVGRRAKLSTCNRAEKYADGKNIFYFDGDYIVCNDYHSAFCPFNAKETEVRVKVTDDMCVEIENNNQVLDTTVFI